MQQKKSCLLAKKVCYGNDRKQEKKRWDLRDFKNLKKKSSLQIFEVALPSIYVGVFSLVVMFSLGS